MKYSDQLADWLVELGYTHCFFVAGGNIMHLLESCNRRFTCIPVVHEVAAGIAAEYFTEFEIKRKAFALVTAGPGLTNIVTAIAGAYLESHELLVIGGQVKVSDLALGQVRQRGIQEVDGVGIVKPITVTSTLLTEVVDKQRFAQIVESGSTGRKGPVFVEIPLDLQGRVVDPAALCKGFELRKVSLPDIHQNVLDQIAGKLRTAERPVLLLGGGVSRPTASELLNTLETLDIPLMTTWNGFDRIPSEHPLYFGRPNTWGQRSSNILIQQSDLVLALGTRLGLQQTGFNWQKFVPVGEVIQVDCDPAELTKGHPRVALPVCGDANAVLRFVAGCRLGNYRGWVEFCRSVRQAIPLVEPVNSTADGFISPYIFVQELSHLCSGEDVVIPCSSGGAYTVMMQTFEQKAGQRSINTKGLASMGYGLGGAIGAAFAANGRRTILVEGDGGFMQNLQELGTVSTNHLNLKLFIFDNNGYSSIRMTQKNYFDGHSVGCDAETGLGIPKWEHIFAAYGIPMISIGVGYQKDESFLRLFQSKGPAAFLVKIDPEQTYFPKISSRVGSDGAMESNPLHLMSPELPAEVALQVFRYLPVSQHGLM
jgi:acetolactate synthase-1/2/3 large subunit